MHKQKVRSRYLLKMLLAVMLSAILLLGFAMAGYAEGDDDSSSSTPSSSNSSVSASAPEDDSSDTSDASADGSSATPPAAAPRAPGVAPVIIGDVSVPQLGTTPENHYLVSRDNPARLLVRVPYTVHDNAGAAGTIITVTLENVWSSPLFTEPTNTQVTADLTNIEAEVVSIATSGNTITVKIKLNGGAVNSTSAFELGFSYDNSHWGIPAHGVHIATAKVVAEKNGETCTEQSADIYARELESVSTRIRKLPSGDMALDVGNRLDLEISAQMSGNANTLGYWRYQPGTFFKLVLELPVGAVLDDYTTFNGISGGFTFAYDHSREVSDGVTLATWTWDNTVDADGYLPNVHTHTAVAYFTDMKITFPSASGFTAGSAVTLNAWTEMTYYGAASASKVAAEPLTINLTGTGVHMRENVFGPGEQSWQPIVSAETDGTEDNPTTTSYSYKGIENGGSMPVPEACFTWINDTAHPANLFAIRAMYEGYGVNATTFKHKIVFLIMEAGGGTREETIYDTIPGSSDFNLATKAGLAAGEYLLQVDLYALNNPNDSLAAIRSNNSIAKVELMPGASLAYNLYYKGWPNGQFPNGTAIQHLDTSDIEVQYSWKGESNAAAHTAPAVTQSGGVYTMVCPPCEAKQVVYLKNSPAPAFYFRGSDGVKVAPGGVINTTLYLFNNVHYTNNNWINPVVMLFPSDITTFDPSQTLVLKKGDVSQGNITCTPVTVRGADGKDYQGYKLVLPVSSIAPSNKDSYTIALQYTVKSNTPVGDYCLFRKGNLFPGTYGMIFGTSTTPVNQFVPNDIGIDHFFKDTMDLDGNPATQYLSPWAEWATYYNPFSVVAQKNIQPAAELLNNDVVGNDGNGTWQPSHQVGAEATVDVGGSGQVRLTVENTGNTYLSDIELLNILPQVGDLSVAPGGGAGTGRSSQWDATLLALEWKVYSAQTDAGGNPIDISANFRGSRLILSTHGDPAYYKENGIYTLSADGSANSFAGADVTSVYSQARSFLFRLDTAKRLAPGDKIVITITLKAPDSAIHTDVGNVAYNSYGVGYTSYNSPTENIPDYNTPIEPAQQKLILSDNNNSSLSGVVFKDYNANGSKESGEPGYEGVTVGLYYANLSGMAIGEAVKTTVTGPGGAYNFANISGGRYCVKATLRRTRTAPTACCLPAVCRWGKPQR